MPVRSQLISAVAVSAGLLAGFGSAFAGPLDPALVPSDARWAAHLDMEAATASKVGAYMKSSIPAPMRASLDRFAADFGIDPFTDVRGLTIFATGPNENRGAAIALVSPAADRLGANLAKASLKNFTSTPVGDATIMSWEDHGREWHVAVSALNENTRAIVFADSIDDLHLALKLVGVRRTTGGSPALTVTDRTPRQGSLFFAAMRDVTSGSGEGPHAQVLRAAKSVCVDVGEETVNGTPHVFADLTMLASTDADAVTMRDMFQGMIAMGRLGSRGDAKLAKAIDEMADAVKLGAEGQLFRLTSEFPSDRAIEFMKLLEAQELKPAPAPTENVAKPAPAEAPR